MSLLDAREGEEYIVREILTEDEELDSFCFLWDATVESQSR